MAGLKRLKERKETPMNLGTSDGALHNLYMKGRTRNIKRDNTLGCASIFYQSTQRKLYPIFIYATIKQVWTRHNAAYFPSGYVLEYTHF